MKTPDMNNYELILELSGTLSERLVRSVGMKTFEKADDATRLELWKFWKPFREVMRNAFAVEEFKNGSTFELVKPKSVDAILSKIKYDKLCSSIEETFGVSSFVVKKKDFLTFNVEELKRATFHIPLIIAYELDDESLFKLLTVVGEMANIIWIRKED